MPTVDVHQHLWPELLIEALASRRRPPRLRGSTLDLAGRAGIEIDLDAHGLDARIALLDRCELDVAVVSLSPTLGIADLPADEAAELAGVYESGILELSAEARGRIVPLAARPRVEGFAGSCVRAAALSELDSQAPLLDQLEQRGAFLFVHPGPSRPPVGAPAWWAEVVDQTAQMQAAYAAWLAHGAGRWPGLRVVFALLAGGGPFQLERLQSQGVSGRDSLHENVLFDTASYGRRALELCLSTLGVGQVLFGSDAPRLDPKSGLDVVRSFGDAVVDALWNQNPSRLLP